MRTMARLACLILLLMARSRLEASQTDSVQPKGDQKPPAANCQIKRSILPDGTLEIQNQDCSVTRVTKSEMLAAETGPAGLSLAPAPQAANTTKLHEIKPQAPPAGEADPAMRAKYLAAMNGYFDYYAAGYAHRQRVFEWQLISSKIIFFLVSLLVVSGVYFAAIQFHAGMRKQAGQVRTQVKSSSSSAQEPAIASGPDLTVTTISASPKGIEVSSPVLGVIILVISLAFFYLYLVYVYPITELF